MVGQSTKCPQQFHSLEQHGLLAKYKNHIEQKNKKETASAAPVAARSSQCRWQLRWHHDHSWLPRDSLGHSSVKCRPRSYGNSPSSQHFCYTGVTAVDVANQGMVGRADVFEVFNTGEAVRSAMGPSNLQLYCLNNISSISWYLFYSFSFFSLPFLNFLFLSL